MMGDYAVVVFEDEDAVALVSMSWVEKEGTEQFTYWPGHKQSQKAKRHEIPDKESWGRHRIRVLKVTGSYEKARNVARKAEETSNLESDDDIMQQRNRRPPTRFSDSGSDADLESDPGEVHGRRSPRKTNVSKEIPMPQLLTPTTSKSFTSNFAMPKSAVATKPTSTHVKHPTTPVRVKASESNFEIQVLCALQRIEEGQRQILQYLRGLPRSENVEDLREPFTAPAETEAEFDALEEKLTDPEYKQRMIRYLGLVGGGDAAETARRIMKKLGSNQLWSSFNVHGRKGKRGLKTTRFFPVIIRACMKNHAGAKEDTIEKCLGEFLKRTFLPGGKKYKKPSAAVKTIVEAVDKEADHDVEEDSE